MLIKLKVLYASGIHTDHYELMYPVIASYTNSRPISVFLFHCDFDKAPMRNQLQKPRAKKSEEKNPFPLVLSKDGYALLLEESHSRQ